MKKVALLQLSKATFLFGLREKSEKGLRIPLFLISYAFQRVAKS
jgi:hypothetical protein